MAGADARWFHAADGKPHGPVAAEEIVAGIRSGRIGPGTLVWREGMQQWAPVESTPEFQGELGGGGAAPPILGPPPPPGYVAPASPLHPQIEGKPSAASWVFGFHDRARTGYHQGRLIGSIDSMIFGILSLVMPVVGLIFAIMAIPVATKAIGKANAEPGRYSGKGMAIAGLATALTSIFLHVVYALLLIASLD